MAKIRAFFVLTIISSFFLVASCSGLFMCISTKAYEIDTVQDYAKKHYKEDMKYVADKCAELLHNRTFSDGMNRISEYYDGTMFNVFLNTNTYRGSTDNYDPNTAELYSYYYSKTYTTSGIIYKLDFDGEASVVIGVSISPTFDANNTYIMLWNHRYLYIIAAIISGTVFLSSVALIGYFSSKGHPLKSPFWIDKMAFYLYLLFGLAHIAIIVIILYVIYRSTHTPSYIIHPELLAPAIILAVFISCFASGIARRVVAKRVHTELFVYKIGARFGIIPQGILLCAYMTIIIVAGALLSHFMWPFAWIFSLIALSAFWIFHIIHIHRLDKAITDYCYGDWSVSTNRSPLLLGNMNNNLYKLSASMQATVEKSVRDERTKTELITNVSHDIKTPLTSIINYTDLLKREDLSEESRKEYLDVLSKNSARMKKLIEDLIEASKAATGNIELHPVVCNIDTLLSQAVVEHEPDGALRNLKYVLIKEKEPMFITIDGEKLYRVFDNLLSNANKYSLSGSRIYVELYTDLEAHIRFKNISEEQITISPEELTERFVKGDMSRHSEGSGLGLAICKNLVELMGGRLDIDIDGDQFMVTLSFPLQD